MLSLFSHAPFLFQRTLFTTPLEHDKVTTLFDELFGNSKVSRVSSMMMMETPLGITSKYAKRLLEEHSSPDSNTTDTAVIQTKSSGSKPLEEKKGQGQEDDDKEPYDLLTQDQKIFGDLLNMFVPNCITNASDSSINIAANANTSTSNDNSNNSINTNTRNVVLTATKFESSSITKNGKSAVVSKVSKLDPDGVI